MVGKDTPLHKALKKGDLKTALFFIQQGLFIHTHDEDGDTPLHIAAGKGLVKAVEALIDKDVNIEVRDKKGLTPLYFAVVQREIKVVEILLKEGSKWEEASVLGVSPLHIATFNGSIDIVKALLENKNLPNIRTKNGWTSLHVASFYGWSDIAEYLIIEKSALVDAETYLNKWAVWGWIVFLWGILAGLLGLIGWLSSEPFTVSIFEIFTALLLPAIIVLLLTRPTNFSAMANSSGDGWVLAVLSALSRVLSKTFEGSKSPFDTEKTFTIFTPLDIAHRGMNQAEGPIESHEKVIEILKKNGAEAGYFKLGNLFKRNEKPENGGADETPKTDGPKK